MARHVSAEQLEQDLELIRTLRPDIDIEDDGRPLTPQSVHVVAQMIRRMATLREIERERGPIGFLM